MRGRLIVATAALAALIACGGTGDLVGTEGAAELELLLDADTYRVGDEATVSLRNNGDRTFVYRETFIECDLTYTDETGRRFQIPPGTHCDIVDEVEIGPGETKELFSWPLEECVRDDWGCVEAAPLGPGTYTVTGAFTLKDDYETAVEVAATFTIVD